MVKKIFVKNRFIIVGVFLFFSILFLAFYETSKENDQVFQESFSEDYGIYALSIPDTLYLAGEPVPVDDFDVRERLDRELMINTYWQSQTLLFIKKANRYFDLIEPILEANDIPEDMKYLPLVESGFMHVVSPAGASGFWQFLKGTAGDYGLTVNREVDERYHILKSTKAACDYFHDAYEQFGSWTLSAAAYNAGRRRIKQRLDQQKVDNYYDLYLNAETGRYVFRLLALKLILENPQKYGFHLRDKDLYYPVETREVVVESTISDLAAFAKENNSTYKMLKVLNPWLRSDRLTIMDGNQYKIQLPAE